ncbi:MAG: glycosyltransferase family 39 protein [bacterium]|nr:glycosyltransferase family 39 protein [bacterium]
MQFFKGKEHSVFQNLRQFYYSRAFLWGIVCFGLLLHTHQYAFNRSLWVDEAALALNIIERPPQQLLLEPLGSNQAAPPAFLLTTKLFTQLFGESEYILRLISFLSSIMALFVFWRVARFYLTPPILPVALILFAISGRSIYHSSAFKPYSSDVCISLLLYWATLSLYQKPLTLKKSIGFGILGSISLWYSYPAVFILAGLVICQAIPCFVNKRWELLRHYAITWGAWFVSGVVLYFISFRHALQNSYLQQFWAKEFMPFPPTSFSDLQWYVNTFFTPIEYLLGFPRSLPVILQDFSQILASMTGLSPSLGVSLNDITRFSLAGISWLFLYLIAAWMILKGFVKLCIGKRHNACLLTAPLFLTLLVSGLQKYPFGNRLIRFLLPTIIILWGAGAEALRKRQSVWRTLLILSFMIYPVYSAAFHIKHPHVHEEARSVVQYLKKHQQADDIIYVYYASCDVHQYYSRLLALDTQRAVYTTHG